MNGKFSGDQASGSLTISWGKGRFVLTRVSGASKTKSEENKRVAVAREEAERKAAEEAAHKDQNQSNTTEVETALVVPALESFDGAWTATDNDFTIYIEISGSSLKGKIEYHVYTSSMIPFRVDGEIDSSGRVDIWLERKNKWGARKLVGTMPHLDMWDGGRAGGANFVLKRVQNN